VHTHWTSEAQGEGVPFGLPRPAFHQSMSGVIRSFPAVIAGVRGFLPYPVEEFSEASMAREDLCHVERQMPLAAMATAFHISDNGGGPLSRARPFNSSFPSPECRFACLARI